MNSKLGRYLKSVLLSTHLQVIKGYDHDFAIIRVLSELLWVMVRYFSQVYRKLGWNYLDEKQTKHFWIVMVNLE
jgi:Na+/glutamate symporter